MALKWGKKKKRTAVVSPPSPGRHRMCSYASPSRRSCGSASANNRWQRVLVGSATNVSSSPYCPRPMSSPPSPSPSRSPSIGNRSVTIDNCRLRLRPRRVAAESCRPSGSSSGSRSRSSVDDDGDEDYNPTLDDHRRRPHSGKKKKSLGGRGMELIKKLRRRIVDSNSKKMVQDHESDGQNRGGCTPSGNRSIQNENHPVSFHPSGNRSIRNENRLPPRAMVATECSPVAGRRQRKLNVILDVDPDENRRRIVHPNSKKVVQDQENNRDENGQSGGGSDTGLDGHNLTNGEHADQLRKCRVWLRENKTRQHAVAAAESESKSESESESSPKSPLSVLKTSFSDLSAKVEHNMQELKILGSQLRHLQGDHHGQQEEEEAAYWLGYLECRHQMKQDFRQGRCGNWSPPSDGGYAC